MTASPTTTYAIDRLTFERKANGDRVAIVDGIELGTITKGWARVGGNGWSIKGSVGQTHKTMKAAARQLLAPAIRDGRIQNAR